MSRMGKSIKFGLMGVAMAALVACTAQYRNHGYVPLADDLTNIVVGIDTRDSVAETVGLQLQQLGRRRQVLCVTHLGQVAACGHRHLAVSKSVRQGQTFTAVKVLEGPDRVAELARMIGGQSLTAASRNLARELLDGVGRNH